MLDADPTLSPDEVKSILTQTASRMPNYDEWEVGAGYINVHAAVDQVFNRSNKQYGQQFTHSFNEPVTPVPNQNPDTFHVDFTPAALPGGTSANARSFNVLPGTDVLEVYATFDSAINQALDFGLPGNAIGLVATDPSGRIYTSGIALPVLDDPTREVRVKNPMAGAWTVEVRGVRGLAAAPQASSPTSGAAAPGPVDINITYTKLVPGPVGDIQGHAAEAEINFVLRWRMMDTFSDGTFRPDASVTRQDLAETLYMNTPLRQTLGAAAKFSDVTGATEAIAEAVTSKGSNLRDWYTSENALAPGGMMSATGSTFNPAGLTSRIDLAVALVRGLGLDAAAKAKAGTNVTVAYSGQTLVVDDNAAIPVPMRGYVQIALDKGLLQARFSSTQGPFDPLPVLHAVVKPNDANTRAMTAYALDSYRQHFVAGN
jgi:serine protease AprX